MSGVQIPDKTVCVSLRASVFREGMNIPVLTSSKYEQVVGQTGFFKLTKKGVMVRNGSGSVIV